MEFPQEYYPGSTGYSNDGLPVYPHMLQVSASLPFMEARNVLFMRITDWHENRLGQIATATKGEIKDIAMTTFKMKDFKHWAKTFARLHEKQPVPAYLSVPVPRNSAKHYEVWWEMVQRLLADLGNITTHA